MFRFEFANDGGAPRRMRRIVDVALSERGYTGDASLVQLLATELMTNAMRHGLPPFTLTLRVRHDLASVIVEDGDSEHLPEQRDRDQLDLTAGGRGLIVVDAIADDWGFEIKPTDGKSVWFRVGANGNQGRALGTRRDGYVPPPSRGRDVADTEEDMMKSIRTPEWVRTVIARLESSEPIDGVLATLDRTSATLNEGSTGEVLRGDWLGHALHPLMTDVPLGCWLSASLLDVVGGRRSRTAARRLVGIGILAAVPTSASGIADFGTIASPRSRRVAAVHGAGNSLVLLAYLRSWRFRRRGRHLRGMAWALFGGGLAVVTGYLGGHLSFARSIGTGERSLGIDIPAEPSAPIDQDVPIRPDGSSPAAVRA